MEDGGGSDGGGEGGSTRCTIYSKDLRGKKLRKTPAVYLAAEFCLFEPFQFFFSFFFHLLSHESTLAASEQRRHAFIPACAFSLQHSTFFSGGIFYNNNKNHSRFSFFTSVFVFQNSTMTNRLLLWKISAMPINN